MNMTSKLKHMIVAFALSVFMLCGAVLPGIFAIKANAAGYTVTLVPASFTATIGSGQDSVSLSQDDLRGMITTGSIYIEDGAPLSIPGPVVSLTQVNIVETSDWNTYISGSDTISQAYLNTLTVGANRDEFESTILGSATTKNIPLTVVVFDTAGNVSGLGTSTIFISVEKDTETQINGVNYTTIITQINDLAAKVEALKSSYSYDELAEELSSAAESLDADSIAAAILSVQAEIDAENAQDTPDTDKIAALTATLNTLSDIKNSFEELSDSQATIRSRINALKEQYNTVQAELEALHQTAGSENIGYAGTMNGKPVVYINGEAFTYSLPGEEYTYTDSVGNHTVVKYHADAGFDFFITVEGVNIINDDGTTTIYEDTLTDTLIKADAMLAELSKEIVEMQTELTDFYTAMKALIGDELVEGTTTSDMLLGIESAVRKLITDYTKNKTNYVAAIQTINPDMTEEEILALSKSGVIGIIEDLEGQAQDLQDKIQKTLTGSEVTDATRMSLENLLAYVDNLLTKLETDEESLTTLLAALDAEDADTAVKAAKELATKAKTLESQNATLTSKNTELAKLYADTKTALTKATATKPTTDSTTAQATIKTLQNKVASLESANSTLNSQLASAKAAANPGSSSAAQSTIKTLQNKVASLESSNSSLTSQLASARAAANTAATRTTPSTTSNTSSATVTSLQNRVSDLTNKLAQAQADKTNSDKDSSSSKVLELLEKDDDDDKAVVELTDAGTGVVETEVPGVIDERFSFNKESEATGEEQDPASGDNGDLEPAEDTEEKKGLNPKAIIFICVLIAAILGLGGFILYTILKKKPNKLAELDSLMEDDEDVGFDTESMEDDGDSFSDGPEIDDSYTDDDMMNDGFDDNDEEFEV